VAVAAGLTPRAACADEPSAVDIAQARDLFNDGRRLRERGDLPGALEKLKAAYALAPTPIIGLELGHAYEQMSELVEAREAYLAIGRMSVLRSETGRSAKAREEAERLAGGLRARIPSLTVHITGAEASTVTVTIDGAALPSNALLAPRPVNPGKHEVVASAAGRPSVTRTADLAEAETKVVELDVGAGVAATAPTAPLNVTPSASPVPRGGQGPGPLVYTGFGLAAAGIVVGSITGVVAMSKASSVKQACSGLDCPVSVDGDLQTGRTLGNVSTASFIVAGVGIVAGAIGLVLPHRTEESSASRLPVTPWIGWGASGFEGVF